MCIYSYFMEQTSRDALSAECHLVANTCVGTNTRRLVRRVSQLFASHLAPLALEPTQFSLLVACYIAGDVQLTDLAGHLGMDRTTLARNLTPLVNKGFVQVRRGDDKRERRITLTDSGRLMLERAMPFWRSAQNEIQVAFGKEKIELFLHTVAALEKSIRY